MPPVAPDSLEADWARVAKNSALVSRICSAAVLSHFGVGVTGVDSQHPGSVVACRDRWADRAGQNGPWLKE